ncbi:MAG: hypothetical protein AB1450_08225 [Pseudomonadota bacterium]
MEQGALPLESPPETFEQAERAVFERLPRRLRRQGFEAVIGNELLRCCLELGARARLKRPAF